MNDIYTYTELVVSFCVPLLSPGVSNEKYLHTRCESSSSTEMARYDTFASLASGNGTLIVLTREVNARIHFLLTSRSFNLHGVRKLLLGLIFNYIFLHVDLHQRDVQDMREL